MSKQPRSGLGAVKRDWTANSKRAEDECDSDVIAWSPSPPPADRRTDAQKRIQAIEDALKFRIESTEQILSESSSSQASSQSQKRRVDSSFSQPPAKKRQLPGSWTDAPSQASKSLHNTAKTLETTKTFGANNKKAAAAPVAGSSTGKAPNAKAASRIAGVFLSAEQNHILKLVQNGTSIFYTGSAGEFSIHVAFF